MTCYHVDLGKKLSLKYKNNCFEMHVKMSSVYYPQFLDDFNGSFHLLFLIVSLLWSFGRSLKSSTIRKQASTEMNGDSIHLPITMSREGIFSGKHACFHLLTPACCPLSEHLMFGTSTWPGNLTFVFVALLFRLKQSYGYCGTFQRKFKTKSNMSRGIFHFLTKKTIHNMG